MCLQITHVPTNKTESLFSPCYKHLFENINWNGTIFYRTPYRATVVKNGWLINNCRYNIDYFYGDSINGNHIHSYLKNAYPLKYDLYKAYAFNIKGFEEKNDLRNITMISKALYIPDADLTGKYKNIIEKILNKYENYSLTKKYILDHLPFLRDSYE